MKRILALCLLSLPAFGQVTIDNGVCSAPATDGQIQWGCTFVPDVTPPDPLAYSRIVALGDSWTDDNRYVPWVEEISISTGIPLTNKARSGDTTAEILAQAQLAIADGIDPDALYTYWSFPNDFDVPNAQQQFFQILAGIEANASETFRLLLAAGATNILIMDLPPGSLIPISAGSPGADLFMDYINQAFYNAAAANGLSVYPSGAFISSMDDDGVLCWLDSRHMCKSSQDRIAARVEADLF